MSSTNMNEDLRSIKTERALYLAMFSLLKKTSFKRITVKGICEEAFISRAAFYAHFIDKYDLLKFCLTELWSKNLNNDYTYEQKESVINRFICENARVIRNLLDDADNETFALLFEFMLTTQNITLNKPIKNKDDDEYIGGVVLANFYAGGIISYFLWQLKNKFPPEVPVLNRHLHDMINGLKEMQFKEKRDD